MHANRYIFSGMAILALSGLIAMSGFGHVSAIESSNYKTEPHNEGNSSERSTSTHYQVDSQVGDVAVGTSGSGAYQLDHGYLYPASAVSLTFIVAPEKRVANPPNGDAPPNWDLSDIRLRINPVGSDNVLFEDTVGPTDTDGRWITPIPANISPGVYDIRVKGLSHLSLLKTGVNLSAGNNLVDMSDDGSGGIVYMLAGDVNLTFGDDKVNSLDIGTTLRDLNTSTYRTDLNQDDKVNSLDLGMVIANLNLTGQ